MQGTVKRVMPDKGFGFIRDDASGKEFFFHRSSVEGMRAFEELREGDAVTFESQDSAKGPRAARVREV